MPELVPHRQVIVQQNTLYVDKVVPERVLVKIETRKLNQLIRTLEEELVDSDLLVVSTSVALPAHHLQVARR